MCVKLRVKYLSLADILFWGVNILFLGRCVFFFFRSCLKLELSCIRVTMVYQSNQYECNMRLDISYTAGSIPDGVTGIFH